MTIWKVQLQFEPQRRSRPFRRLVIPFCSTGLIDTQLEDYHIRPKEPFVGFVNKLYRWAFPSLLSYCSLGIQSHRQIILASSSCTKPHRHGQDVVLVKQQSPINPITVLKNYLHVSYAPLHTTLLVVISLTWRNFLRRCNSTWQQLASHV